MTRHTLAIAFVCAAQAACTQSSQAAPLRLGTTTTVEQSGALALLDSLRPPTPLRVIVASSGTILHSAAAGDLDVVITHAPSLEQRLLIDPEHAVLRCPFVASRFAIVGPPADPAHVASAATAAEAFRRVATARAAFISRGDSSGTHIKELSLWKSTGVTPDIPRTLYVIRSASENSAATRFSTWALADWRTRLLTLRLPSGAAAFAPLPDGCSTPVAAAGR